ncbi:MAG: GIY-YIG nuclease family protein [Saprospiraceae bacterium]|nr:GIY-YIG nuclease family protein [Saprospiraceae bacterium]
MNTYYAYILFSESLQRYYTGSTNDLVRRFNQHNAGKTLSTCSEVPWILMFKKEFDNRSQAVQMEILI